MTTRLHFCRPELANVLADELGRTFPESQHRAIARQWVECRLSASDDAGVPSVAFAAQCLPNPSAIEASSISRWADAVCDRLLADLGDIARPWRLHVFGSEAVSARRCDLIRNATVDEVKRRRRKLWKQWIADPAERWTDDETFVQVALRTASEGWCSLCPPAERVRLRRCLSQWPGGKVAIADDAQAPSQAHRKLREALLRMDGDIAAGEQCVDLGAAPGGWSWVALSRGASVLAVDRSPLREDLMSHPRLTFQRGDAFRFEPERPVDWLLCDVIAFPARTLELLDRWLTGRWCRSFCVTIKFRGREDDPLLEEFKRLLSDRGAEFQLRQLDANRNEVTAFGNL